MKLIPVNTDQMNQLDISLGLQGENLARALVFDVSGWRAEYGEGTVQLLHRRFGDKAPYPAAIEQEGAEVIWPITAADTAMAGTGRLQLLYFVGETLVKQMCRKTFVGKSLGQPGGEVPEAAKSWVEQVLAEVAKVTGMKVNAVELPLGSEPTAEYSDGVLTIGIPLGGDVSEAQIAQAVADYLAAHPIEETDPTVPDWARQPEKPGYTADEVGALSAETLPDAINTALAKAKESGEFDGPQGPAGPQGEKGDTGETGPAGADGQPGTDGKSAYQYAVEGGYTGTEAEFAVKLAEEMPDKLPNPNALTFTGAVEGSYDGSAPLEVEIPSGGDPGQWEYIGEFMESDQPTFESGKYRFFYAETFFTSDTSSAIVYRYPCIDGYHYCRWAFPSVKNRTARILIAHGLCALLFTEDGTTYPSSTARGAANMHPAGGEDASVGTAFWATSGADYPISTFGIKLWGAK